jgi:hypothetical protein
MDDLLADFLVLVLWAILVVGAGAAIALLIYGLFFRKR